ncbi:hypothetical protein MKX08_001776 [Trichoderma sp. CBMAI-0020]|nr:hypothetical protein MKX08_001776 [Trichoderma sp. CBMAI-0020]
MALATASHAFSNLAARSARCVLAATTRRLQIRLTLPAASLQSIAARLACPARFLPPNGHHMGGTDGSVTGLKPTDPAFQVQQHGQPAKAFHGLHGVCHPSQPSLSAGVPWRRPGLDDLHTVFFTPGAPLLLSLAVAGHSFLALGPENGVWP